MAVTKNNSCITSICISDYNPVEVFSKIALKDDRPIGVDKADQNKQQIHEAIS